MKVKFMPQNVEHEIEFNETVLHLAQRHDIHIQSVCKGIPSCAECRVQIKQGEHHVLPPSSKELSLIGTAHYIDHSRLSCQLRCFGDVTVDISEQVEKESRAAKRPQGRASRPDGEKSFAVKGNIIEEYKDDSFLKQGPSAESSGEMESESSFDKNPSKESPQNSQKQSRSPDIHRDRDRRHGPKNQASNNHRNSNPNQRGAKNSQNSKDLHRQRPANAQMQKNHENKGNS